MKHLGTVRLETQRLVLRRFCIDDAGVMFNNWASNSDVTEFLSWNAHKSQEDTKELLEIWAGMYDEKSYYNWAIELKKTGEPIGSVGVVEKNDDIGMIHTGYCIGKQWWGMGIVTEAYKELIRFFFEQVGVRRIEAWHAPENPGSGKVMQKCGMQYEGTLRKAAKCNRGITDMCMYSILAEDYFSWKIG